MSLSEASESEYVGKDRRSSVRARSMLPFTIAQVAREDILEVESRILDMAVLDSEHAALGSDWSERADELPREARYVLSEIRALRQQLTEIARRIQHRDQPTRWVVINDRGLWIPALDSDPAFQEGDFVQMSMRIPSLSSPEVLALGEVTRVRSHPTRGGIAVEFRSISDLHSRAIIRYALRRERELARSKLFSELTR